MTSATSTVLTAGDRSFPWSGELPATWSTKPLKYLVAMNAKTLGETTNSETLLHYIDIGSVSSHGEISDVEDVVFEDAPSRARRIVLPGDVLISTVRTYLRAIAFCEQARENLICSTGFAVVTARRAVDPKFLFYWARSSHFVDEIVSRSLGVSYPAINAAEIGNLPFPLISQKEQQQIAAFLDRKTAELDAVLALKERQLKLLAEKRQALISQAVTRGLDPAAPLKPSGIDWLGDVPEHWEVVPLKFLAKFAGGGTPAKENLDFWAGDIPWVSPKDMKSELIEDTEDHITSEALAASATSMVPAGTVLMVVRSGILKHTIPVAISVKAVSLNQDMKAMLFGRRMEPSYFALLVRGNQNALLTLWRKAGATVESIEHEYLANTECPVPPLTEQWAIVAYLDRETASLDGITQAIRTQIEKVREYRQALISAAVTGKIDVRNE
jgi:type I restriction enzyme S subunit